MRDEDEAFARIIRQEFDERWPPAGPATPEPTQPLPDFHLNLYDDEESYRKVSGQTWAMSRLVLWGLGLVAVGLVLGIVKIAADLPVWVGWACIACFVAGVALCVWQVTHSPRTDDEEGLI